MEKASSASISTDTSGEENSHTSSPLPRMSGVTNSGATMTAAYTTDTSPLTLLPSGPSSRFSPPMLLTSSNIRTRSCTRVCSIS